MSGFRDVEQFVIPEALFEHSHITLRRFGERCVEGLVLWAGTRHGNTFNVRAALTPAQRAFRSDRGHSVVVGGPELHRIGTWLYAHALRMAVQVHSHPREAYHSEADDAMPITTTAGSLSLVVPEFARGPARLSTYAGYRLSVDGAWIEVPADDLGGLVKIVPRGHAPFLNHRP